MDQAPPVRAVDDEIDLRDLILPLVENWRRIAAAVVAAALLAGGVSFLVTPTYESEVRLRIVPLRGIPDVGWSDPPAPAYAAMAEAPGLQAAVAEQFDPSIENPRGWFDRAVDVTVDTNAGIVTVTTRADTAAGARDLALSVSEALIARSQAANVEALRQLIELELAQVQDQVQAVEEALAGTDRYVWVQEALTQEAARVAEVLEQQGVSGEDVARALEAAGAVGVVRQEINPLWQTLNQRATDLRSHQEYLNQQVTRLNAGEQAAAYASLVPMHDAPLPLQPVAPRTLLNVVVGAMLGGMLAVFWVLFRRMWAGITAPAADNAQHTSFQG